MSASPPNLEVEIDNEKHHLKVVPSGKSRVVAIEKERLLGVVDLKTLVEDIKRVGDFIRIAYYGVGAAGYNYVETKIEIQRLGYDITRLCDESALAVNRFQRASGTILNDLQATYGYLVDGVEGVAIEMLSDVSKEAAKMVKVAEELQKKFNDQAEKVRNTLETTQKEEGRAQKSVEEQKRRQVKLKEDQELQRKIMMETQKLEREAEAERRRLEAKEDKAIKSIRGIGWLGAVVNAVAGFELITDEGSHAQTRAMHWKSKRIEALERERSYRQQRYEALQKMSSLAVDIQNSQSEQGMAKTATKALCESIAALRELSAVMMQAALFWKQMQDHCESLADERVKNQVERAMKLPEEQRQKMWTSNTFKMQAVRFYAGWVALKNVCTEYAEYIKVTQSDLYKYIRESPTDEECRENVHTLAEKFLTDLRKDQKAIKDKNSETQAEINTLSEQQI